MAKKMNRRDCLQSAAYAGLGLLGATTLLNPTASAIEPIKRSGGARFKYSLAAYSYRRLLGGDHPELTLFDFINDCAQMGLDGTELTSYYFPNRITKGYLNQLKSACFTQGLDISGTAVGNDFCHPPGEKRDNEIAHVKKWVDYAAVMGAPVIRIFSGNTKSGQTRAQAHRLAVEGMELCCDYAGQKGVFLALENHGGLTSRVDGILALVRDVSSPWFGVNLDTGNFHSDDIYGDLTKLAPYALNVQVKVEVNPAGGQREPTDFGRLAQIVRDTGYQGYIVLEYEESGDPRSESARYIELIRKSFG